MPTQFGTASALSSSSDNIRPGYTLVQPPDSDAPTLPGVKRHPFASGQSGMGSRSSTSWDAAHGDDAPLEPGTVLAARYEILDVLGKGGMGSVYKAKDQELDRLVALKVIRPELARNAAIVDRFKQELRLSHLVTHKNVIRMYDLGEDAGLRFITMEFVEGRDLRSIIEESGKLEPAVAVGILQQICRALEAAHAVGILHRDLKPQNIMQDAAGRVVVMDFGLARTIEGDGMTQSGALVGTMEYMSPEQALGKDLDQRSDIFALGLICYEMLTGNMPFRAESALASLIKRTQERAAPISDINPTVPGALSGIVGKCLERDITLRYANTGEILQDLEVWDGKRAAASVRFKADVPSAGLSGRWLAVIGAVILVALLAVAGVMLSKRPSHGGSASTATAVPAVSLAIMPFYNGSGDPTLDWLGPSLAEMLNSDIGQSPHVRMVSPDRLHQVLTDLHISGGSQIDVAVLRRLAEFTNAETVVYGQYVRAGGVILIDTTILDLAHDSRYELKTEVPSEKDLLTSVDTLAADVRQKLAANPDILKELQTHAARPSTNSVAALRAYDDGLQLERAGRNLDAQKQFEAATLADPNFALAFSKLGEEYSQAGHDDLAEQASRRAVDLSDSLPAQEKYLIEANNARITKDTPKAIAAYEHLATENPANADVQLALAGLYEQNSDYDSAKKRLAMVLASDPKNVDVLLASGRVELKAGNAQTGLDFLTRALTLAIQLDNTEERAAILQATGIAYGMLNKPDEALRNFNESLAIKKEIGDKRGVAASLDQIANIQDSSGHSDEALASYKEALATYREIGDQARIGDTLIDTGAFYHDHGNSAAALKDFTDALQMERELGDESKQAMCLDHIGAIRLAQGEYQDALTYLDQGYQLRQKLKVPEDIAESLHNLAETNTKLGQYDAALGYYLKAIDAQRSINNERMVAMESDGMAKIFAVQGRYGAALSSMHNALTIFQKSKQMTFPTVEIIGGWGDLLSQVGRKDEGRPNLDNALNIAHQIKDDAAASLATNWIGDDYYYKGDYFAARQQYDQALAIASKTSDKEQILISKVNKAKVELALGHGATQIAALKKLSADADALGLKSVSVECSVYLGQALIASKNYSSARQELDLSLARAEKLGLRVLEAKTQYLLATLLVESGKSSDATPHYREVVRILESISKEDNSARVLERADLQGIYRESMKGFQGSK
jgi:tetratricopeptide (TPR) repeat protein/predicted Ser/Thr protein kinase